MKELVVTFQDAVNEMDVTFSELMAEGSVSHFDKEVHDNTVTYTVNLTNKDNEKFSIVMNFV